METTFILVFYLLCSLFNWSVPYCSMLAVIVLCGGAILFYFIPPNYIVLAWGMSCYTKQLIAYLNIKIICIKQESTNSQSDC